jgi:hypothetical protein
MGELVSRRGWRLLIPEVIVVAVVLCGWFVGRPLVVGWLDPQHNSNARHYVEQTRIQHGFRRIGSAVEGTCRCTLTVYYIGPADIDPAQVFDGPGLTLNAWPPGSVGDTRPWDFLLTGGGSTQQAGYCNIGVDRYQHSVAPADAWSLSRRERAYFQAGKLDILALALGCGADGA